MNYLDQFKAGKLAVNVKTEEEAKRILEYLDDKYIKWGSGHLPSAYNNILNNRYLVVVCDSLLNIQEITTSIFSENIISASEFLEDNKKEKTFKKVKNYKINNSIDSLLGYIEGVIIGVETCKKEVLYEKVLKCLHEIKDRIENLVVVKGE